MEHVLVIKRALLEEMGMFQGFQPGAERYLEAMLAEGQNFFMERPAAELDPTHKQLIPYSIFRHGDSVLCYRRGGKGGEKRLVAKRSVGIGGHINPIDAGEQGRGWETYQNGVEREMAEELKIGCGYTQKVVGLINDDSNEVGQVHLGVVHVFEMESQDVASNEDAIEDLRWVLLAELAAEPDGLETWSAHCVAYLAQEGAR
jgi:predicted NUDIX family phosphoesterase